jgi:hypothetical protein
MLVLNRFRIPVEEAEVFRPELEAVHALFAARPGYLAGWVAHNVDDPELWVLATRWEGVGAYRRALSSYDVKVGATPVLSRALQEASAFEVLSG